MCLGDPCEIFAEMKTPQNTFWKKKRSKCRSPKYWPKIGNKLASTKKLGYCQQIDMFNL